MGLRVNGNGQCAQACFCDPSGSLRASVRGGQRGGCALLLVRAHAVTLKPHVGRVAERRSGGTKRRSEATPKARARIQDRDGGRKQSQEAMKK